MAEIQQPTVDIFIVIIDQELAAWKSKNMLYMTWQTLVNIYYICVLYIYVIYII